MIIIVMSRLSAIVPVPTRFWSREFGTSPLPKAVSVVFEVAGQAAGVEAACVVAADEKGGLRMSGLWAAANDQLPGHSVFGWSKVDDGTILLKLQPPDSGAEQDDGGGLAAGGLEGRRFEVGPLPGMSEPQVCVTCIGSGASA